ncbi:hypothetical protein [Streptomyces sp. IB2014 016-6]|uniref:hypothetical protein n=1 Tax=Streptomyces sp. IB2014 016-6 TaxID=2517818 RepID=UPI0011C80C8E|nr:hypothetical protein [Streptomyces sp. IB2014 016-6]TXL84221.1 hypothetical protein EW053_35175 [Streptomyces sp. IB2014 016-6]
MGWSANRRILIVALVITCLLAVAATVAWFTGRADQHNTPRSPAATSGVQTSPEAPMPDGEETGSVSVPPPAQIAEPVAYAKAAALMLWSYDTRTTSRDQQLAGMRAWLTEETEYADWASVAGQVPDPLLWSRLADQDQHATATVTEGHFPSAFKQALADDPSAITEAYIYVVTVNGTQKIGWAKGGAGAEERAVTLAVQCRPDQDCTLAALAPTVTQ